MKLHRNTKLLAGYSCILTKELDILAKLKENALFRHYVVEDKYCKKERFFAIRVPGGTVGYIQVDQHNVITGIQIDTNYVIKTYPKNVEDIMQKYVGNSIKV